MPPKITKKSKKPDTKKEPTLKLPPVPEYEPLQPHHDEHEAAGLPAELCTSPLAVFQQLFTNDIWEAICKNTNAYYQQKSKSASGTTPRPWKDTTVGELKVWLGLILYMGIIPCPATSDYWDEDTRQKPMSAMSLCRFQQLKRYLHISPPVTTSQRPEWWEKMEPMSSIAQERCKQCYLPSSNVAIDEMMVKCEGRSVHTLTMPNKPIDHGYKLFAIADHGYTYGWIYNSRVSGPVNDAAAAAAIPTDRHLSPTSRTCLRLSLMLPYSKYQFNVYFDNYFTNTALFATLREYGIGACGTARRHQVPKELQVDKSIANKELDWNDLFGAVKDGVLCGLWQDSSQVYVMSTIHNLQTGTTRLRRRPKETSGNAISRAAFGDDVRKLLTIPDLIDDYNHHMNGVDIADQLRSSYNTHLKGCRNCLPLFYWLVDTLKVNSYLLLRMHYPNSSHKKFQLKLSQQLIAEGLEEHILLSAINILPPAINNDPFPVHCLDYINRKKVLLQRCIVCKARTCFHCTSCQNAFCWGKSELTCTAKYPCS